MNKDGKVETLTVRKPKDVGNGGISKVNKSSTKAGEEGSITYKDVDSHGKERNTSIEFIFQPMKMADLKHFCQKGVDKSQIFYAVEDYAGNKDFCLFEFVSSENSGPDPSFHGGCNHKMLISTFGRIRMTKENTLDLDKGKISTSCRSVVIQYRSLHPR